MGDSDIKDFILQSYVLGILKELKNPKRFNDLAKTIKNRGTLTVKLAKMKRWGLIQTRPKKIEDNYVNTYTLSKKGKTLLNTLEKLDLK